VAEALESETGDAGPDEIRRYPDVLPDPKIGRGYRAPLNFRSF